MRPLEFARPRTVSEEAEAAAALRWLEQQPVPEGFPAFAHAIFSKTSRRYVLAVAQRHPCADLAQLVRAGHAATVAIAWHYQKQPKQWERFWAWCMLEEIITSAGKKV